MITLGRLWLRRVSLLEFHQGLCHCHSRGKVLHATPLQLLFGPVLKPAPESEVGRISVAVSDDASAVRRMGQVGIDSFKSPKLVMQIKWGSCSFLLLQM